MLKLRRAETESKYYGFTLKEGFWYGIDTESGKYIATSGWEVNNSVAIYTKEGDSWNLDWFPIEDTSFELEGIPEVNTKDKLSFKKWLEEELGIDWNTFDECYDGDQEYSEYLDYFYDGLPKFAQKYIESESL